ncbi:MAG: hypothetical protein CFE50_05915 [Pseudomonas sp. PGPPP4]|nr:MAG: hypothetical protein CFE50_05915 [Pseudomonas sp. PGPPP4]
MIEQALATPHEICDLALVNNDFKMNAMILAVDLAGLSQLILAIDRGSFGRRGEGDFREMQVDGIKHYRGACSLADFRFMLEHDATVVGPLIAIAQPVIC